MVGRKKGMKKELCYQSSLISSTYVLVIVEVNLTVVITVYGLKFHVLNFPFSNLNGKPETIDAYGDDRKERPLEAVTKKLECIAVELDAVAADNGVLCIPFHKANSSPSKTKQYKESAYRDKSELHNAHFGTFCANATNYYNESCCCATHNRDDEDHEDPRTDKVEQATSKHAVVNLCFFEFLCLCHLFASFTLIAIAKSVIL